QGITRAARHLVKEIDAEVAVERTQALEEIGRAQRRATLTLLGTALVTLLAATGLGLVVTQSIARPLRRLDVGVRALARGDFQHQVAVIGQDEMASLATMFNDMASRLRRLYAALRDAAEDWERTFDAMEVPILMLDREGRVALLNRAARELV